MALYTRSRLFIAAVEGTARRRAVRTVGAATAVSLLVALAQGPAVADTGSSTPADSATIATSAAPTDSADLAAQQAVEKGKPVEVEGSQTATSTTYANPDGTSTVEITQEPSRTKQDGRYVDIDPTLQAVDGVVVRGHEKVPTGGQVQVSTGGHLKVPTPSFVVSSPRS